MIPINHGGQHIYCSKFLAYKMPVYNPNPLFEYYASYVNTLARFN